MQADPSPPTKKVSLDLKDKWKLMTIETFIIKFQLLNSCVFYQSYIQPFPEFLWFNVLYNKQFYQYNSLIRCFIIFQNWTVVCGYWASSVLTSDSLQVKMIFSASGHDHMYIQKLQYLKSTRNKLSYRESVSDSSWRLQMGDREGCLFMIIQSYNRQLLLRDWASPCPKGMFY